jgi:hypothetical protein
MPRNFLHAFVLALASATPAFASGTVTRAQALDAIRAFESNAAGGITASKAPEQAGRAVATASHTILKYSLESDDVVVDLGAASVPWFDARRNLSDAADSGERGILLVAYLSGSVRAQLMSGKVDPNPYPGWIAMLRLYHALKISEGVSIPEIEALAARQMDGTLQPFAAEALQHSRDLLQRTHGTGRDQARQLVTASQP